MCVAHTAASHVQGFQLYRPHPLSVHPLSFVSICLIQLEFYQVSLGVEGSTMSGSLQRRKKSKRKWKRLWFLLKDKVLYTFTAREVRGAQSFPTPAPRHSNCHHHSITVVFPHNFSLHFFLTSSQYSTELFNPRLQCSTFPPGQNSVLSPFLLTSTLLSDTLLCSS